jgi:hypothetical protein
MFSKISNVATTMFKRTMISIQWHSSRRTPGGSAPYDGTKGGVEFVERQRLELQKKMGELNWLEKGVETVQVL